MKQDEVLKHYEFQANIGMEENIIKRIEAHVIDMTDRAIVQACIKTASEAGVTDLYLMDKQFVREALFEKVARMKNEPLTLEELRQMDGEPVYCPEEGMWGIVKVDAVGQWKDMPFLLGCWRGINCEFDIGRRKLKVYRQKVDEGRPV